MTAVSFNHSNADDMEFHKRRPSMANVSFRVLGEDEGYTARIKAVVTNLSFMALCMTLSGLFFVVTGIQYWLSDYLKNVFGRDPVLRPDGVSDETV